MSLTAKRQNEPRWFRSLESPETLADDLGVLGSWVGPRTGIWKRDHGQKEDYSLRRLLVAWKRAGILKFPVDVRAEVGKDGEPDFVISWSDGTTLGIEITEAGEENYQAWLTASEVERDAGNAELVPLEADTNRTAKDITKKIAKKVKAYDQGKYRGPMACDLLVYDNTCWGGFLDKSDILRALGHPSELLGRFRQIHIIFGETVYLDVFGSNARREDVSATYEIDYAKWLGGQVDLLRRTKEGSIDWTHIAEELDTLGRSERRALASHLRNLMLHLLKWEFQPNSRSASWSATIQNTRAEIYELVTEMPSLKHVLKDRVGTEYRRAVKTAAAETNTSAAVFPEDCPYSLEQILDSEFLPGEQKEG